MKQEKFVLWNKLVIIRWSDHVLQLLHCNYVGKSFSYFQKSGIFFFCSMSVGLVLWIRNKQKTEACWWKGCKRLGKVPSDYVEVKFFWKYHSRFFFFLFFLNFCPLSDRKWDSTVQNVQFVAPGHVCHHGRGDRGVSYHGERWEGMTQRKRQVAWVSLCVFDKYSLKNTLVTLGRGILISLVCVIVYVCVRDVIFGYYHHKWDSLDRTGASAL